MSELSYTERLKILKLPTLAYRRLRGDLLEIYKILNGHYDKDTVQFIKLWKDEADRTSPRGQQQKLYPQQSRINLRKFSLTLRSTKFWNDLPVEDIMAPSINSLKNRLDKHYEQSPVYYDDYRFMKKNVNHRHNISCHIPFAITDRHGVLHQQRKRPGAAHQAKRGSGGFLPERLEN